jgi:tetratricopeptide (TPR) repeat protein
MAPFDPTAAAYLAAAGLATGALAALASVAGGVPTEFLADFLRGRLAVLRQRLGQSRPGANHDLYKALTDSYWLALLHVASAYGERVGETATIPQKLGLPGWCARAWAAMTEIGRGEGSMSGALDREILRGLYPKLIAPIFAAEPAAAVEADAVYREAELLLGREAVATVARDALLKRAEAELAEMVAPHRVPAAMLADLRQRFDELFRLAFAERIKENAAVRDIFVATMVAETNAIVRTLPKTLARIADDVSDLNAREQRQQAVMQHFVILGAGIDGLSRLLEGTGQKLSGDIAAMDVFLRIEMDRLGLKLDAGIAELREEIRGSAQSVIEAVQGRTVAEPIPPFEPARCYGREADLAELERLLLGRDGRHPALVCSVQGLPGVGKSLLVETFAFRHWREHFPGGYVSLKLDPEETPSWEPYADRLAGLLGIPAGDLQARTGMAAARLRSPWTLLHIENVDSDAQARAAAELLGRLGSGLAVVISSRVRELGRGRGWRTVELEPVGEEAALAILAEYEIGDSAESRLLVKRLGRLPLAIRLLGGAVPSGAHTVRGLLAEVSLLDIESRDPSEEERRRQLRACFAISLRALQQSLGIGEGDGDDLAPLRDFGHLPLAGVGLDLACAWCGLPEAEFRRVFAKARGLSLVIEEGRRWRAHPLLADYLREVAAGEAESADAARWLRVTEWFAARMPEGDGQRERWAEVDAEGAALEAWLDGVPGELIRVAARAGCLFAVHRGPWRQRMRFCERGLAAGLGAEADSNLLWTLANVAMRAGELDKALEAAERKMAVDGSREDGERESALAAGVVADIREARGDLDEALRIRVEEQLPVYEKLGDVRERAVTLGRVADIREARGDLEEALRIYEAEVLPVLERLGAEQDLAMARWVLAQILMQRGRAEDRARIGALIGQAQAAARMGLPLAGEIEESLRRAAGVSAAE